MENSVPAITIFENLTKIQGNSISVSDWLDLIKNSDYSGLIQDVRAGILKKDEIKNKVPCALINFKSPTGRKRLNDLTASTNLIYTEIDHPDLGAIDLSKIFACYKSLSGRGWHFLIRVQNVTLENFQAAWNAVNEWIGIDRPDSGACKPTQIAFLSYDPELFYNPDSQVFDYTGNSTVNKLYPIVGTGSTGCHNFSVYPSTCRPISYYNSDTPPTYSSNWDNQIRFNNINEFVEPDEPYRLFPKGVRIIECFIPARRILVGKRNDTMLNFVRNLVFLNPAADRERLLTIIKYANKKMFVEPLETDELIQKLNWAIEKQKEGKLRPKYSPRLRRILYNPKAKLSVKEKQAKANQWKVEASKDKIKAALLAWDHPQPPSVRRIAELTGLSKNTICRHLKEVKSEMFDMKQAA